MAYSFVMTGGGTGGHVYPALAVARVLRERGHQLLFIGNPGSIEARIVPAAGFSIEFVRSGGLNRVGLRKQIRTTVQLPAGVLTAWRCLRRYRPQAIFSTGGFVSGPVMMAGIMARIPLVVMEPNLIPGFANRKIAKRVYRALVGFSATAAWFPAGRSEFVGVPIRREFFDVSPTPHRDFTVLITGGSLGARTLNKASRESWPLFREHRVPVRIIHQTGASAASDELAREFRETGLAGEVVPFITDMPKAFAEADLVICRSGAGTVNELSAAGMASILVPFPYSANDHQRKNAEELAKVNAARLVPDDAMNGRRFFEEVEALRSHPEALQQMRAAVRQFAKPGAAERAADVMEEAAARGGGAKEIEYVSG